MVLVLAFSTKKLLYGIPYLNLSELVMGDIQMMVL
jgi:hypothetical protein